MITLHKYFITLFLFLCLFSYDTLALEKPVETNYFASLRASTTNVRSGPGSQYPIKFTFKLKGLPIKVISEYDNWSEIKDYQGETGWVSQNLITKKRQILVKTTKSFVNLYSNSNFNSKVVLKLENNVVADFLNCNNDLCFIKVSGKKGWLSSQEIWGVDDRDFKN